MGGVESLPTNRLVLKLLDATPGRRERAEIKRLLDECRTKISNVERSTETWKEKRTLTMEHRHKLKTEITAVSSKLTEAIRQKQGELCREVDKLSGIFDDKSLGQQQDLQTSWLRASHEFVEGCTEDVIRQESLPKLLKRRERLKKISSEDCELSDSPDELIGFLSSSFSSNKEVFRQVEEEGLGRIVSADEIGGGGVTETDGMRPDVTSASHESSTTSPSPPQRHLSRSLSTQSATIDITVSAGDLGLDSLSPLSISSSPDGDIALADPTKKRLLILNREGRHKKTFTMDCSGVAYSPDGHRLAICLSKEVQVLSSVAGCVVKVLHGFDSKLRTVSYASTNELILTCEPPSWLQKACVWVRRLRIDTQQDLDQRFYVGGSPFKTIHYNEQYFVSNTSKGCIMVYNERGLLVRQFGKKKSTSGALTSPTGLAMHPSRNQLLVCDENTNSIQIYETNGMFVEKFAVGGQPSDITILLDGTVVVCSQTHHWVKYFSMF